METTLEAITKAQGVLGAAIFDANGTCVVDQLKPPYEAILLTEVLTQLREINDNYLVLESNSTPQSVTLKFKEGSLSMRSLGLMSLVVISEASVNPSVVNVALTVATLKLTRMLNNTARPPQIPGQGGIPTRLMSSSSTLSSSHLGFSGLGNSSMGRSSLGTSLSLSGEWSSRQTSPPGAVGMKVMRHLLKTFLRHFGRDGIILIDQELKKIGERPSTVRDRQFADLLKTLANHIPDPTVRSGFLTKAMGD